MNTLELRIDPYKLQNDITLNGKKLSAFSVLSDFVKKPFISWADNFYDLSYKEINDEYHVVITAEKFEVKLLSLLAENNNYCKSFSRSDFSINTPIAERKNKLVDLLNKYDIDIPKFDKTLKIYTELPLGNYESVEKVKTPDVADVVIISNNESTDLQKYNNASIVLTLGEKEEILCPAEDLYVWCVTLDNLKETIELIKEHYIIIPYIRVLIEITKDKVSSFSETDKIEFYRCSGVDVKIDVKNIPAIEVGTSFIPEMISTGSLDNYIVRMESQNPKIISINDNTLTALDEGTTVIRFFKEESLIPFAVKTVETYKDRTVHEIQLSVDSYIMGINQEKTISISFVPVDAEDRNSVKWMSDNPNVISVDNSGNIVTKERGVATITATTQNAIASVIIEVQPDIESLCITPKSFKIYRDQAAPHINIDITPANCYDKTYSWESTNPNVAVVDDQNNVVIKGIGSCELICTSTDKRKYDKCEATIISTLERGKNPWISYAAVAFVILIGSLLFSYPIISVVAGVVTSILGIVSITKSRKDIFWSALLIILAIGLIVLKYSYFLEI